MERIESLDDLLAIVRHNVVTGILGVPERGVESGKGTAFGVSDTADIPTVQNAEDGVVIGGVVPPLPPEKPPVAPRASRKPRAK